MFLKQDTFQTKKVKYKTKYSEDHRLFQCLLLVFFQFGVILCLTYYSEVSFLTVVPPIHKHIFKKKDLIYLLGHILFFPFVHCHSFVINKLSNFHVTSWELKATERHELTQFSQTVPTHKTQS